MLGRLARWPTGEAEPPAPYRLAMEALAPAVRDAREERENNGEGEGEGKDKGR